MWVGQFIDDLLGRSRRCDRQVWTARDRAERPEEIRSVEGIYDVLDEMHEFARKLRRRNASDNVLDSLILGIRPRSERERRARQREAQAIADRWTRQLFARTSAD